MMDRIRLGDILHIKHGYAFKGEYFTDKDTGKLVLTPGNFSLKGGFQNTKKFTSEIDFPEEFILKPGDLIVTMTDLSKEIDTIGYSAIVPNDGKQYLHNQRIGLVTINNSEFDKGFVYWLMRSKHYQRSIANTSNGATVHHTSPDRIYNYQFEIISIDTQRRIASILSAYDNLIENNNKRICLLEQMAENLYKEWFVRFRFPGHEKAEFENGLPKGWSLKNLFDVADVSYGYAFKSDLFCNDKNLNAVVRIRDIQDNHTDTYTSEVCDDKYLIEENAILVGMDGLFHMCLWNGEKAYLNQRVVKICSKKKDMCNYMIFMAIRPQIKFWEQVIAGTTVAHLGDKHLKKIKIAIPTEDLLLKANESIQRIMVEKNQLFKQNQILSRQRDLLLPRLMSGKLEVK